MFASNKKSTGQQGSTLAETIIGKGTKIVDGLMNGESSVRIDGEFFGLIDIQGDLILGEGGRVEGDIKARSAMIAGHAKSGLVVCKESLHIVATGAVHGDIRVGSLVVDEGAVLVGNCVMNREDLPVLENDYSIESKKRYELPEYIN